MKIRNDKPLKLLRSVATDFAPFPEVVVLYGRFGLGLCWLFHHFARSAKQEP